MSFLVPSQRGSEIAPSGVRSVRNSGLDYYIGNYSLRGSRLSVGSFASQTCRASTGTEKEFIRVPSMETRCQLFKQRHQRHSFEENGFKEYVDQELEDLSTRLLEEHEREMARSSEMVSRLESELQAFRSRGSSSSRGSGSRFLRPQSAGTDQRNSRLKCGDSGPDGSPIDPKLQRGESDLNVRVPEEQPVNECSRSALPQPAGFDSRLQGGESDLDVRPPPGHPVNESVPPSTDPPLLPSVVPPEGKIESLRIWLVGARKLRDADVLTAASDPYCICEVPGKAHTKYKTKVIDDTLNPSWNEIHVVHNLDMTDTLRFSVFDKDFFRDELLGKAELRLADIYPDGWSGELELYATGTKKRSVLVVRVEVLREQTHHVTFGEDGAEIMGHELSRCSQNSYDSTRSAPLEEEGNFVLWPIWLESKANRISQMKDSIHLGPCSVSRRSVKASGRMATGFYMGNDLALDDFEDSDSSESEVSAEYGMESGGNGGSEQPRTRCWRRCRRIWSCDIHSFVFPPGSNTRFTWDMLAMLFVAYESVVIPMNFLDLPPNTFTDFMAWVVRIFWTADLPLCFFTGYFLPDGRSEMRLRQIMKNYFQGWFAMDTMMLFVDWSEVLVGGVSGAGFARVGRNARSLRLMRIGRLFRLLRLKRIPDFAKSLSYILKNESVMIFFGVIKTILFIVWINHTIACVWFALAHDNSHHVNWIHQSQIEGRSREYHYLTSFHWSLTQFIGSMEIVPTNTAERFFAVAVLVMAFMVSAAVISSITSSMTRLQIVTAHQAEQMLVLKQYLSDNKISSRLAFRVQRNVQYAVKQQKICMPEHSIELLDVLSIPLKVELHFEMHMPLLSHHIFFKTYSRFHRQPMKQVCHTATATLQLMRGDLLFAPNEICPHLQMYFISSGLIVYHHRSGIPLNVKRGDWACEATLWTPWAHCGSARAKTEVTVLVLDGEKLQEVLTQTPDRENFAINYGRNFVKCLNNSKATDLTDLLDPLIDLEELVKRAQECPVRMSQVSAEAPLSSEPARSTMLEQARKSIPAATFSRLTGGGRVEGRDHGSILPVETLESHQSDDNMMTARKSMPAHMGPLMTARRSLAPKLHRSQTCHS